MENIKVFIMIFLLFSLSNCLNTVNTFIQEGYKTYCKNYGEEASFSLTWNWTDKVNIPNSFNCDLEFEEGKNLSCSFNKNTPTEIICPNQRAVINSKVKSKNMGPNQEYYLKSNDAIVKYTCSSLYSILIL